MYLFISYCDSSKFIVPEDGPISLGEINIGHFFLILPEKSIFIYLILLDKTFVNVDDKEFFNCTQVRFFILNTWACSKMKHKRNQSLLVNTEFS